MASNKKSWPMALKQRCEDVGWTVEYGGSGHYKVFSHENRLLFTFPSTPSSARSVEKNALAEARRQGLDKLEAATAKMKENDRLLRIARDRARAAELDAGITLDPHGTGLLMAEPTRIEPTTAPAMTMTNFVPDRPASDYVDPPISTSKGVTTIHVAPSRDVINGRKVVTTQTAHLRNPHGTWPVPEVLELLLDDGSTAFLCNSARDASCTAWSYNGNAVRSHLRSHSERMINKRLAVQLSRELSHLQAELNRRDRELQSTNNGVRPPRLDDPDQLAAMRRAGVEGTMEQIAEIFGQLVVLAANASRQFEVLSKTLAEFIETTQVDPEVAAKAAKFDQLKGLMQ